MTNLLPLTEIAEATGRTRETVLNWTKKRNRQGKQLFATQVGGTWYTTEEAWAEYAGLPKVANAETESEQQKRRHDAAIKAELYAME